MPKRYFILAGKEYQSSGWEMLFGDYYKSNVRDEQYEYDMKDWYRTKIITLDTDDQWAIYRAMDKLNAPKE